MEINEREFRRLRDTVNENNKMLHKMRRQAIAGNLMRVVYYLVIIGFAVSSYYFLQPFVEAGRENVNAIIESIRGIQNAASGISDLGSGLGDLLGQ